MAEENLNEKDEEKTQNEQAEQAAQNDGAAEGSSDGSAGPSTGSGTADGEAADPSTSSGTPETPEEKIAALEKEVTDLKTQALYKAAENDNWRKRMMQQKDEAVAYANASLLGDLLDSLDNFDRTLDAAKDAKDAKSIADGIKMINKSLVKMLEDKYGLVSYGKEGDEFNPEEHEAIGRVEDEKAKKETLAQVYLKGYKLKDKVIRHAKVMVKVPKA